MGRGLGRTWLSCLITFCATRVLFLRLRARCNISSANFSWMLWWCCRTASSSAADCFSSGSGVLWGERSPYWYTLEKNWPIYNWYQLCILRCFIKGPEYKKEDIKCPCQVKRKATLRIQYLCMAIRCSCIPICMLKRDTQKYLPYTTETLVVMTFNWVKRCIISINLFWG